MALQLHINVSLNRLRDRTWRRPPGRPRNKWLDQIPPVRLETSGGVLSTVDMVVQRRDGPRWLRELDDDDDDDDDPVTNFTVAGRLPAVLQFLALSERDGSASLYMWHVRTLNRISTGSLGRRSDRPVIRGDLVDALVPAS